MTLGSVWPLEPGPHCLGRHRWAGRRWRQRSRSSRRGQRVSAGCPAGRPAPTAKGARQGAPQLDPARFDRIGRRQVPVARRADESPWRLAVLRPRWMEGGLRRVGLLRSARPLLATGGGGNGKSVDRSWIEA
jgi:hypothetical protein